jgi:hypothetical protein|eukprot:COSAG01_NODE_7490_length_3187_cov_2.949482_4_plen_200_part_00
MAEPEPEPEPEPGPGPGPTEDDVGDGSVAGHAAGTLSCVLDGLENFQAQQLRRVQAYHQLADAQRMLMRTGDLFTYQKCVQSVTVEFKDCSARIMAISGHLRGRLKSPTAAQIMDDIQGMEQQKLQLTVALHTAKVHAPPAARDILCESQGSGDGDAIAATMSKLKSLAVQLGTVTEAINEQLEELRYLKEEERESQPM